MSLQIKVISAQLSHDTQTFSNMDPYCILMLGSQRLRTKTKKQAGKKPVWNETFKFNAQNNDLKIKIMDEDTMSDDLVGEGQLNLSKFRTNSSEQDQIVQLYYKGKTAGKVMLRISAPGGGNTGGNQNNTGNQWGQSNQFGNNNQPFNSQNNQWGQSNPYGNQQNVNQWGQSNNNQFGQPQQNSWGSPNYNNQLNQQNSYNPQLNNLQGQGGSNQWGNQENNGWGNQGNNGWGNQGNNGNNGWGNQGNNGNNGWGNTIPSNPTNPTNVNLNQSQNLYPDLPMEPKINPLDIIGQSLGKGGFIPGNNPSNNGYGNVAPNNPPVNPYNYPQSNNTGPNQLPFQVVQGMQGLLKNQMRNSGQKNPYQL